MAEKPKLKPGKSPGNFSHSPSQQPSEAAKPSNRWINGYEPSIATNPDTFVGFAEYLRWMRSPDTAEKDKTKLEILQLAAEKSKSYQKRLEVLTDRTKRIAGDKNTFEVTSTWRIRVGGQRGPESMLLPAWDALGIPYIPSSTLRGVARDRAIRGYMAEGMDYKEATRAIAPYFGSIDASTPPADRMGKVVFLDAYPIPSDSRALAVDIANNIWKWDGALPKYGASPFSFLSLVKPTFVIGIKPTQNCDKEIFKQIKSWLIAGLQSGIGSQVNSGYGELLTDGGENSQAEILKKPIDFTIEGQLIHGVKFTEQYAKPIAEVRPIAFRSMLRYWFRAFSLGVLPTEDVQKLEAQLFGSINPKPCHGWISVHVASGIIDRLEPRYKTDPCGLQSGKLILRYSVSAPVDRYEQIYNLLKNLTWLMFHLGGVGQGARRPLYSRADRSEPKPPWWRGSNLKFTDENFLAPSATAAKFQNMFSRCLNDFYTTLGELINMSIQSESLQTVTTVPDQNWAEAIDRNCCILVCQGSPNNKKPFALSVLHSPELKTSYGEYNPELCGKKTKPSPVWICDKDNYQVVTVFGANTGKRKKYIDNLMTNEQVVKVFPLVVKSR
jgi:CRISPR-associated protein Cmr6